MCVYVCVCVYDVCVMKWLRSKAREDEFYYPWQICDSDDMENLPSVTSLISRTQAGTDNRNDNE